MSVIISGICIKCQKPINKGEQYKKFEGKNYCLDCWNIGNPNKEDLINKPSHYHKGGIDVIGFAELHFPKEQLKGFFRINSLKYLDRYEEKGGLQDLKKSRFYLDKLIELEEQHG